MRNQTKQGLEFKVDPHQQQVFQIFPLPDTVNGYQSNRFILKSQRQRSCKYGMKKTCREEEHTKFKLIEPFL